ncbi:hypothetical protein P389DRAFT_148173 [Cystobasidium minutum MCA 4210]|uniref:uncharacterized protein n=1 Tax=Cystobasidium minutum MCA 4210 TaxID=1397322 RepID=UPI0034D01531|eukprot:jgi/Rhomi1/148173/e_gw1.12.41.1
MSRRIASVTDAWLEYNKGLGGRPSIREMYENGGAKGWKANDTDRKFYDRRMVLVDFIKEQAKLKDLSPEGLASFMEARRVELPTKGQSC